MLCKLNLNPAWLATVTAQLQSGHENSSEESIFKQYLTSDLRLSCTGTLPADCATLTSSTPGGYTLQGSYVLQLEDWCNIALDEESRRTNAENEIKRGTSDEMSNNSGANAKRTLLLTLTDGVTSISALEVEELPNNFIQALRHYQIPGLKVSLSSTSVRHGMLMLSKNSITILGGNPKIPPLFTLP